MTQEDKQLLLIDLCARLPYKVKYVRYSWNYEWDQEMSVIETLVDIDNEGYINNTKVYNVCDIKPYYRPMSSMTEEERVEYLNACDKEMENAIASPRYSGIDWLNKNMFDYRNLIPKSLAVKAPNNMYKEEQQ